MDIKKLMQTLDGLQSDIVDLSTVTVLKETASGGTTSAGGFAPVESSIGIQRRVNKPKSKTKVDEEEINEEDILVHPSLNRPKAGFTPRAQVRTDHEVSMAISDLRQCGKNAEMIYNILRGISEEQGIPGWVQGQITKAADYLNTVAEYMEGEYAKYAEQNRLNDSSENSPRGGYGVVAGGTTMEGQPIYHGADKPAEPWNAIDRIAGGKTSVVEHYARWDGIGFDIRTDHLWPAYVMETKNLFENSNIASWLNDQRENQREPKKGSECVLAIVVYTGKEILVIHGDAQYIGQTPTHYILKNNTGTHQYSKTDQIVFDSPQAFEQFATMMSLKFSDSNTNIDIRKQRVQEAYNSSQQAAIAVNMKKQGKKPKTAKEGVTEETITEKAKSKKQQKFFGMVRAMQKGEEVKGASKELKSAAKSMGKGDVKDFAKTKHKGLPTKVDENTDVYESSLSRSLDESMAKLLGTVLKEDVSTTPGGVGGSTKMFLENEPKSEPHIRKYTKERADGSTMTRWEVLDYRGHRASGQGTEGFDDLQNAKEFLARNKKKLSAPPGKADDINEEEGLWANIHKKRDRIKHGSGERMRKPGSKGAPTAQNFRDAQGKKGRK